MKAASHCLWSRIRRLIRRCTSFLRSVRWLGWLMRKEQISDWWNRCPNTFISLHRRESGWLNSSFLIWKAKPKLRNTWRNGTWNSKRKHWNWKANISIPARSSWTTEFNHSKLTVIPEISTEKSKTKWSTKAHWSSGASSTAIEPPRRPIPSNKQSVNAFNNSNMMPSSLLSSASMAETINLQIGRR